MGNCALDRIVQGDLFKAHSTPDVKLITHAVVTKAQPNWTGDRDHDSPDSNARSLAFADRW